MRQRALSLALAGTALAFSLWLSTSSAGLLAVFFFPFLGAPIIAGMMTVRDALVRKGAAAANPTASAIEVIALAWMFAPCAGFALWFCFLPSVHDLCGLADTGDVARVLAPCWPFWGAAEIVVIVALVRRSAAVVALTWYRAAGTVLTLIIAPPLAVIATVATVTETDHGGAGAAILMPAAVAAGSTVVTWILGRSFAVATALRRVVGVALILGVDLLSLQWGEPHRQTCESFWTTGTWGLVSVPGTAGVLLLIACLLFMVRDPGSARS